MYIYTQWNFRKLHAKPLISSEIVERCMRDQRFPVNSQKVVSEAIDFQ